MPTIDIKKLFTTDLPAAIEKHPDEARKVDARYQVGITGATGGDWFVNLTSKGGGPKCTAGKSEADCTITISDDDFQKLCEDPQKLAMQLFFSGKLKVGGNVMLATKLGQILSLARDAK
jgi:putative sterol carrier protein